MRTIWSLMKETFSDWSEDKVPRLGAALAYYTIFSLAPLLVIMIGIAGLVFGQEAAQGRILDTLTDFLGPTGGEAVNEMLANARRPESGIIATVVGITMLLFGASGVFAQLQDTLNTIWEVKPKAGRGIWGMLKDRFLSFTMVLGIGFLLLVSLLITAALQSVQTWVFGEEATIIATIINLIVSFGVIMLLFALIYKVLPDVQIGWRDVWIGAAVTAALFLLGKYAISFYITKFTPESTYGAASSVIIILLWVYYSAQILFLGAEFTQVYANRYGSRVIPDADAEPVNEHDRAQQGIPHDDQTSAPRPVGRRAPKPAWGAKHPSHAVALQQRFKQLKRQRYGMALAGFLAAVFLGGLRNAQGKHDLQGKHD